MKNETQHNLLPVILALLLGAYARFLPAIMVDFPVTDGGLFYAMVHAIQAESYRLPVFVDYNGMALPFTYPPLGFYLTALLADALRVPVLEVMRWLPAAFSVAFAAALYPLANSILKSSFKAGLATALFALLPRSVSWYVMGGGITRAPGHLFLLLTLFGAHKLFTENSRKHLWLTIGCGAGVLLSHPEAALHAISLCGVLWLFYGRSKEGVRNALLAAAGVALLAAPFYALTLARHGLVPYQNAAQTSFPSWTAWLSILTGSFADEKFVTAISALALLGLAVALLKREYLLVVWLFLPALVNPRSAASVSLIAWALLAAIAFADVILPGFEAAFARGKKSARLLLPALIFYAFFGLALSNQVYPKISLTQADRAAMQWVVEHVPPDSRFVIVNGQSEPFADAVSEWFPALTHSVSVATIQGYEWLGGDVFRARLDAYASLQPCLWEAHPCVEQWAETTRQPYDYVLVKGAPQNPLVMSLAGAEGFDLLYRAEDIFIFARASR